MVCGMSERHSVTSGSRLEDQSSSVSVSSSHAHARTFGGMQDTTHYLWSITPTLYTYRMGAVGIVCIVYVLI